MSLRQRLAPEAVPARNAHPHASPKLASSWRVLASAARIAWRHMVASPRTVALALAGVAIGVAVFIFTVSLMDGLVEFFTQRILRIAPTLTVLPERLEVRTRREALARWQPEEVLLLSRPPVPDERLTLRGAPALAQQLRSFPGVRGVALAVPTAGVLAFGTAEEAATLLGMQPSEEAEVTELSRFVVAGWWSDLSAFANGVVLGYKLAQRLGVQVGDRLVATGESGVQRELEVVGLLAVGLGSWDESTAVVNLPVAQGLAGWAADEAGEVRLRTSLADVTVLKEKLEALIGHRVETWQEANQAAFQLFRTIGLTTYLLTGFVLVVAGFGISNKLGTIILDKEPEIAIMRAYGFSKTVVRTVFLIQGVLLGAGGALLGCLGAWAAVSYFRAHPIRFAPRDQAVLAYTELYLANKPGYYLFVGAAAVLIALVASLLSVRRAARVLPVEVLRGRA